jgi:Zn finger protein HypA/HybF involved in hydrogenase expression
MEKYVAGASVTCRNCHAAAAAAPNVDTAAHTAASAAHALTCPACATGARSLMGSGGPAL